MGPGVARNRDRGCRFPGCESRQVDRRHVKPWSQGGETELANLCSLCRTHHRYLHELRFRVEVRGDGGFAFFDAAPVPRSAPPSARRRKTRDYRSMAIQ